MKRNEINGRLFRKGALRRSFGVVIALMIVVLAVMAQYGLSSGSSVDSRIASNDFVDVGFEDDMNREKVHLDLVENTLTRKCLLVESWDDALGAEDLSFYLRDSNFDVSGKAELYSVEQVPEVVRTNLVYEDVPYECGTHIDNDTEQEVATICYNRELKSYDNTTVYNDKDVFVGEFDFTKDLAAGSTDFSGGKRLKLCFNTPIVKTLSGWGNAGTVFVGMGDRLLVDMQGSSWWNTTYTYKRHDNVTHTSGGQLNNFTYLANGTDGFTFGNGTHQVVWVRSTSINSTNYVYYRDDFDYAFSNGTEDVGLCYDVEYGNLSRQDTCAYDDNFTKVYHMSQVGSNTTGIYDSSASGFHAGSYGAFSFNNDIKKFGQSANFSSGTAEIVTDGNLISTSPTTTVELWAKPAMIAAIQQSMFRQYEGASDFVKFRFVKDGGQPLKLVWAVYESGSEACSSNIEGFQSDIPGTPRDWAHLVLTVNTTRCEVWIDGVLNISKANGNGKTFADITAPTHATIGTGDGHFSGQIDEFTVSNVVRSPAWIKRRYEMGLSTLGDEELPNMPPTTPDPAYDVAAAYNLTDLNCSVGTYINDEDADNMDVMFNLTIGGTHKTSNILTGQPNGSQPSWVIHHENYSKGNVVQCNITLFDGTEYSSTNLTSITISNSAPSVDSFNASSLNRSLVYSDVTDVDYDENETVRFSVTASDDDGDDMKYDWLLEKGGVVEHVTNDERVFERSFDLFSSGSYTLNLTVNDSSNAYNNVVWNIEIDNLVNKFWEAGFVSPTPEDGQQLDTNSLTVAVEVSPTVVLEAEVVTVFDDDSEDFGGAFNFTEFDEGNGSVQLNGSSLAGTYTSSVYDAGGEVGWSNLTWDEFTESNGELDAEPGMVALYHMNENSWAGTEDEVLDSSGNANHATAKNGATTTASGKYYRAGSFDGTNDYTEDSDANFPSGSASRTVEAWIKTNGEIGSGEYRGIFSYGTSGSSSKYFGLAVDNHTLYYDSWGGGGYSMRASTAVDDGEWHHVAFVYNGTHGRFYIDGALDAEKAVAANTQLNGISRIAHYNWASAYFRGTIDELVVWNKTLSESEILEHYTGEETSVKLKVRGCDDSSCNGEDWSDYYTDSGYNDISSLDENQYFQYKAFFETTDVDFTARLYNVTVKGFSAAAVDDVTVSGALLAFNGTNHSMSGSDYSWSYSVGDLDFGTYGYRVYVNDTFGNVNFTEERSFTVPSYEITFNVTSGETGLGLNNTQITCGYSGFSQGGDTSNPYGPYEFPVGSWSCTFERAEFYSKTTNLNADSNKIVAVELEAKKELTIQEHDWLRGIYDCLYYGDCRADDFLENINGTVDKIWNEFLPTDESVVTQEDTISSTLSSSSNITINYTIDVPYKEGYDDQELLPIRIFYWFTDDNDECYSQDKQSDSNRAESPFCIPLMAEYLGPNNGTVSFKVDLRPDLPDGTYNVTRSIDIDPIVNNEPVWINYGREIIGSISVVNEVFASSEEPEVEVETSAAVVEAKAPILRGLDSITGKVIDSVLGTKGSYAWVALAGLIAICMTVLGVTYMRRPRW